MPECGSAEAAFTRVAGSHHADAARSGTRPVAGRGPKRKALRYMDAASSPTYVAVRGASGLLVPRKAVDISIAHQRSRQSQKVIRQGRGRGSGLRMVLPCSTIVCCGDRACMCRSGKAKKMCDKYCRDWACMRQLSEGELLVGVWDTCGCRVQKKVKIHSLY